MLAITVDTPGAAAGLIVDCLGARSYSWSDEAQLQEAVAEQLANRFTTCRERALSRADRPEFLVTAAGFTVAVEVRL